MGKNKFLYSRFTAWRCVSFILMLIAVFLLSPPMFSEAGTEPQKKTVIRIKPWRLDISPLSANEAELYRQIFAMQDAGQISSSDHLIAKLSDHRLMGHVLYQRFMHPKVYTSSFDELRLWLEHYGDHPDADKVYALAERRRPEGYSGTLKAPVARDVIVASQEPLMKTGKTYQTLKKRNNQERRAIENLQNRVEHLIREGEADKALKVLNDGRGPLDAAEYDDLQGKIAAAYLYRGRTEDAYRLASASVERSKLFVPQAGWVAGLIAWRKGQFEKAADYFEIPAASPYASGWAGAAGAYWAARAHMRTGNVRSVSGWLKKAQKHPRTFYGLLATRALGQDFDFNWRVPTFTREYYDILASLPAGNRAMALVDAGQEDLAEAELLRLNNGDPMLRDALLSYAAFENLPTLAMRLGSSKALNADDDYFDVALYPKMPWTPQGGFKVDPALMFAIARQESKFNPEAVSPSGAVGLMQILPSTASAVMKNPALRDTERHRLKEARFNLEVAQLYIKKLLKDKAVKGDVLSLIIAYNAGPGNLAKWRNLWSDVQDPLLFIELLPSSETRAYVERVLANYWIYNLRENKAAVTLDAVAEGRPALYAMPPPG
jgi:soluble lytic murein transglycosylase